MRFYFAFAAAAALALAGCGGDVATRGETATATGPPVNPSASRGEEKLASGPRSLHISLDNWEGPENIGILMAEARGYFADEGLEVTITRAGMPRSPVEYVETGVVELGLAHQPQVVMARDKGIPIIALGSLVSQPTAALIWLKKSGIGDIADLEGKTIAIPGISFQVGFLEAALEKAGLTLADVTVMRAQHELVSALLKKKADAIFGGSWNLEGIALKTRGLEPVTTRVEDLGIPSYDEVVVIARPERLAEDPELFRDFMSAVDRGARAAIADPNGAAKVSLNAPERNGEVGRKATAAQIEATLPLLSTSGRMDEEQAADLVEWMSERGMIEEEPPVPDLLTNDYLGPDHAVAAAGP